MRSRVCIVGSNQLTRSQIDWSRDDTDYWLFNEAGARHWVLRCDGVFQMHAPAIFRNRGNVNDREHYAWLQQAHPFPIWMQDIYPDIPSSVKYPLNEITRKLLPRLTRKSGEVVRHFTSSPSYAIALAIFHGYPEIEIVGVEMSSGTEYAAQRDGVTFWIGVATGRGVNVILQDRSLLMRSKLYGYDGEIVIQRQRFEIVANGLAPQVKQAEANALAAGSRVQVLLEALAREKSQKRANELYEQLIAAMNAHSDACFKYGIGAGALSENKKYIAEVDELIAAAGGERALRSMVDESAAN
jgi:hypothetical protein